MGERDSSGAKALLTTETSKVRRSKASVGGGPRYGRLETLLQLAQEMQASRYGMTLAEIGERFGVSRRTAERMRDAVARAFPSLEEVPSDEPSKRWRIPARHKAMSDVEAEDLAELGLLARQLRNDGLNDRAARIDGLVSKLRASIGSRLVLRLEPDVEALTEMEGVAARAGPRPLIADGLVARLRSALIGCQVMEIKYWSRSKARAFDMTFLPHGILYGHKHYLVGRREGRAGERPGMRLLRLGNIERADLTGRTFVPDPDFDIRAFAANSFGIWQEPPFDVLLRFTPEAADDASRWIFHVSQVQTPQKDGSLLVAFRAGGLREMTWHLATWGDSVTVLKPEQLRWSLAEFGNSTWKKHAEHRFFLGRRNN